MALNSTGKISLNSNVPGESVSIELGLGANASLSMLDASVRTLTGKATGAITMPTDFYGKLVMSQYPFSNYSFTTTGVDRSGGGPVSAPGTVRPTSGAFSGQSAAVGYALTLRRYWANSDGSTQTYQSPRDSVFVSTNTNWTITDLTNMGILYTDVRTTSTTRAVSCTFDVDEAANFGYYIVTRPTTSFTLSLWGTGTYTSATSARETAGGRQRNISRSWTLPLPNANQLVIPAWSDGTGTNNLRWSFT